jgi:hypothetical protein
LNITQLSIESKLQDSAAGLGKAADFRPSWKKVEEFRHETSESRINTPNQ